MTTINPYTQDPDSVPGRSSDTLVEVSRKSFKALTVSGVKSSGVVITPDSSGMGRGQR